MQMLLFLTKTYYNGFPEKSCDSLEILQAKLTITIH